LRVSSNTHTIACEQKDFLAMRWVTAIDGVLQPKHNSMTSAMVERVI